MWNDNSTCFLILLSSLLTHKVSLLSIQVKFNGTTPLGTNLDKRIIQKHIVGPARSNRLPKPVLVIVLTDGQPEGEEGNNPRKVFDVIRNCKSALKSTRYGEKAAAFQFVQLGRDQGAQRFLAELDNDPVSFERGIKMAQEI